jgi:hypothetical protein
VQREHNLSSGIVRGARDELGRLLPDHVVGPDGRRRFGADMRRGTLSVWEHQERAARGRDERVVAAVGNGNLTQNPGFVAWLGSEQGLLVRVRGEPTSARTYDCVVLDGGAVAVRPVRFRPGEPGPLGERGWRADDADEDRPLPPSAVAFSGQRIVRGGRPVAASERAQQIQAGLYYDLRHVFRFPAVHANGLWRDVGLERFYDGASLDGAALGAIMSGQPLRTRWTDLGVHVSALEAALADKDYVPGDGRAPGTYRLDGEHLELALLEGIYPHNVFGLDRAGHPASLLVTGWSNNVGYTLAQLAEVAAAVFSEAVLLDNGGDVFFLQNHDRERALITPEIEQDGAGRARIRPAPGYSAYGFAEGRFALRSVVLFVEPRERPVGEPVEAVELA